MKCPNCKNEMNYVYGGSPNEDGTYRRYRRCYFCGYTFRTVEAYQEKGKTEMNKTVIKEVKEAMCDKYCKYPFEIADEEALLIVCNRCPLNRLEIGKEKS